MKLLLCLDCHDIFNLKKQEKSCGCGKTKGKYIDNLNAVYSGNAQPIGFANESFGKGYRVQKERDKVKVSDTRFLLGTEFTAFFIPEQAPTITHSLTAVKEGK